MATAYETVFAIRQMAINQNGWTDIVGSAVLPIDCNTIIIHNDTGQDIFLRTDPGNALSQKTIHDGQEYDIGSAFPTSGRGPRFPKGSANPAGSLMSASSGVSPLIESIL